MGYCFLFGQLVCAKIDGVFQGSVVIEAEGKVQDALEHLGFVWYHCHRQDFELLWWVMVDVSPLYYSCVSLDYFLLCLSAQLLHGAFAHGRAVSAVSEQCLDDIHGPGLATVNWPSVVCIAL